MPELPEVETVRRGIEPHIHHKTISAIKVREAQLRWQVPKRIHQLCRNQKVLNVSRRAKYLLIELEKQHIIIHLGMSGRLTIVDNDIPPQKHDHVDFIFDKIILRYHDPRKFGSIHVAKEPQLHPLLAHIGPEPLSPDFSTQYFYPLLQKRKTSIKATLLNGKFVAGVGNIYANEALYLAHIHPEKPAYLITQQECQQLVKFIKSVLKAAIKKGGTTLKDYVNPQGNKGYFSVALKVYGKENTACTLCKSKIIKIQQQQRSSYFCPYCQPQDF